MSGYARSGKDEAAKVLVEEFGFTRVAFADKLREFLYALNPMVWPSPQTEVEKPLYYLPLLLQEIIDHYGWDGYKDSPYGPEIRRLLQRLGTEAGRETLWDTIWIDAAFAGLPDDAKVVVSDARFFNEFDAIISRGGYVWRIDRTGVGPANDHPSETQAVSYDKFSLYLRNDGTLEEYREMIRREYAYAPRYTEWQFK